MEFRTHYIFKYYKMAQPHLVQGHPFWLISYDSKTRLHANLV